LDGSLVRDGPTNETPCVFSKATWRRLPESASTNMSRCIRHGSLISETLKAPDKETAKSIVRARMERD
jgi:hypothetical protein